MNKKIAILTQPLHDNYGGLLQAYALSEKLREWGNDTTIINRRAGHTNVLKKIVVNLKQKFIGKKFVLNLSEKEIISKHTLDFRNKYFPNLTEEILGNKKMKELKARGFDTYIVGSDQCWRPQYSPYITNYFLDFLENQKNIKRIAYAASFGTSEWEYTNKKTEKCKQLAQQFDAVSVREDSGIDLCRQYLERDALHVLDPTMLWTRKFYEEMLKKENVDKSKGNLKVYLLDKNDKKNELIKHIEEKLGLKSFEVMPRKRLGKEKPSDPLDFQFPSPLEWLRGYQDAEFVIADSFHGTVFAILYNIPFIAIGNEKRGMARFNSLLKMFDLEKRLLTDLSIDNVDAVFKTNINWNRVNSILEEKRDLSINFLKQNLI